MKKSSALMLSVALVYSTERLVSAVEYHAERTNPLSNTYPDGDQPRHVTITSPSGLSGEEIAQQIQKAMNS